MVDVLDVVEVQEVLHAGEIFLLVDCHLLAHSGQHALHQDVLNLRKYFGFYLQNILNIHFVVHLERDGVVSVI